MPVYLGLDTASPYLALALWSPEAGPLAAFCEIVERDHAKRLVPEVEALLERAGVRRTDICGVGVGLGPGSYTGLRVGVAAARGLARGLSVPIVGSYSLEAMAYGELGEGERAVVALDARRGNVYAGVFRKEDERVVQEGEVEKVARDVLQARHPEVRYLEDVPPDALYLARRAHEGESTGLEPLYL